MTMQLMTEQNLEHHHQQQHYHPIEPNSEQQVSEAIVEQQLSALKAITAELESTAGAVGTILPQHHQTATNLDQAQLNQETLGGAGDSYQQPLATIATEAALGTQAAAAAQAIALTTATAAAAATTTTSNRGDNNIDNDTAKLSSSADPLVTAAAAAPAAIAPTLASSNTIMNIQPTSYTKNHLINNNGAGVVGAGVHLPGSDELSIKKRREDLSRRPSYRKIFNDLAGLSALEPPSAIVMGQLAPPAAPQRQSPVQVVAPGQQVGSAAVGGGGGQQAPSESPSPQALDLLNSITVASVKPESAASQQQQQQSVVDLQTTTNTTPTTQQLAQQQQQQLQQHSNQHHQQQPPQLHHHQQQQQQQHHHHLPSNHLQQQQPPQLHHPHHHHHPQQPPQHHQQQPQQQQPPPQHHHHQQQQQQQPQHHHHQQQQQQQLHHQIQATSPPITGGLVVGEEVNKKRELRLQKNREAAKECRRKKKEYIKCLENRVAVLDNQNKALIDELKTLKDLYCKTKNE